MNFILTQLDHCCEEILLKVNLDFLTFLPLLQAGDLILSIPLHFFFKCTFKEHCWLLQHDALLTTVYKVASRGPAASIQM